MERQTRQRAAIDRVFTETARPLDPREVLAAARRYVPRLGIATVYRAIKTLSDEGRVVPVTLPGEHATHAGGMQFGENLPEAISSAPAAELNLSGMKRVENAIALARDRAAEVGGTVETQTTVLIENQTVAGREVKVIDRKSVV